ncbi:MAG: hypothetical protein ABJH63_18845 [Rhizobiaceae bacterium]
MANQIVAGHCLSRLRIGLGVAVFAESVLAGCTTTKDANEGLKLRYLGSPVDDFFIKHGPPQQQHISDSGKRLYVWSENPILNVSPGSTNTTVSVGNGSTIATTTSTPNTTTVIQSQVKIVTSASGTIENIQAHGDTIGNWELSRCAEIFKVS